MASVLTYNLQSTERLASTIAECQRMKIRVQLPCINTSDVHFRVVQPDAIQFGLAAIKGMGESLSEAICAERSRNGRYAHLVDFATRMGPKGIAKGAWEALAKAGALDELDSYHRRQYLEDGAQAPAIIKQLIGRSSANGNLRNQSHLFQAGTQQNVAPLSWTIQPPELSPYENAQKSQMEKEIIGAYLSTHPLDAFRDFLAQLDSMDALRDEANQSLNRTYRFGGMLADVQDKHTKRGTAYTSLKIDGLSTMHRFMLWSEDKKRLGHRLKPNALLCIEGRFQLINQRVRFRVQDIRPLIHQLRHHIRALVIHVRVEHIQTPWITQLEQILQRTPSGTTPLWLAIADHQHPESIQMECKKYPLEVDTKLMMELQDMTHSRLSFEWK